MVSSVKATCAGLIIVICAAMIGLIAASSPNWEIAALVTIILLLILGFVINEMFSS